MFNPSESILRDKINVQITSKGIKRESKIILNSLERILKPSKCEL
jgi:hypothetical protein